MNIYEPLGMKNTYHEWSLGYSVHTTAYDLAIMGQMLLQRGIYDGEGISLNRPLISCYQLISSRYMQTLVLLTHGMRINLEALEL